MKLSTLGEFGLIERIQKAFFRTSSRALLGIGDDAAVLRIAPSAVLLATTDMLLEGIHFDRSFTDFSSLGWKAAAANLSDIAAMGGVPRFCLTALGIPPQCTVEQVTEFYRGLGDLITRHGVDLVGGDTCRSRTGFTVSVTLLGEGRRSTLLARSGARPGDRIFVTGTLGDSAAGLELLRNADCGLRNRKSRIQKPRLAQAPRGRQQSAIVRLAGRHLRPMPRVSEGQAIARLRCGTAMIDVSDGLSSDLAHICEASGVGAVVYADRIPLSREIRAASDALRMPLLRYALSGGEDYELLFTVPPGKVQRLRKPGFPVTEIGVVVREPGLFLADAAGARTPLEPSGYDHFKRSAGRARPRRGSNR